MRRFQDNTYPAVFLDRDGTIIEERGYLDDPREARLIRGSGSAVRKLNEAGFLVVVVTNQSGVARGYFTEHDVHLVNEQTRKLLKKRGARIDAVYYCPHHPEGTVREYTKVCSCRKPETGLVKHAVKALSIDLSNSYVVGDKMTDVYLGLRVNVRTILVLTGFGEKQCEPLSESGDNQPHHMARTLSKAVEWLLQDFENRRKQ